MTPRTEHCAGTAQPAPVTRHKPAGALYEVAACPVCGSFVRVTKSGLLKSHRV